MRLNGNGIVLHREYISIDLCAISIISSFQRLQFDDCILTRREVIEA